VEELAPLGPAHGTSCSRRRRQGPTPGKGRCGEQPRRPPRGTVLAGPRLVRRHPRAQTCRVGPGVSDGWQPLASGSTRMPPPSP
jgi:hypothetical protein